jgi:hypothetical protein
MKTITKKTAKTTKPEKRESVADRLATYKELAALRLAALRAAKKQMRDAERRLDRITGDLNELKNRCFDGNITPNDLANKLAYLGDDLNEAWGKVYEARVELAEECKIVTDDVVLPVNRCY